MARTGRESRKVEEERSGRLVGAAETRKELVEWYKLQRKNFNKLGLPKRERVLQREQLLAMTSEPCQREKEQTNLSRS